MNIFEIERYATEDGPGIRSVVFLKGCNLHCWWCQNPESQSPKSQIMYFQKSCVRCGKCVEICPTNSVQFDEKYGVSTNHSTCTLCGDCIDACFYDARKIVGKEYSVDTVFQELMKDRSFYEESNGGVTFSGGDPLLQLNEVVLLARQLKSEGIHTAIETAGHASWDIFEALLPVIDLFYIDLKHIDSEKHKEYTGVPNNMILSNIAKLSREKSEVVVRIPIIPNVNDDFYTLEKMFEFLVQDTAIKKVELLPYHRLGTGKYSGLGFEYKMGETENLSKAYCEPFAEFGRTKGLAVSVGSE